MPKKLILYHGTSEENAKMIEKEGFKSDKKYNWNIKSKKGFVYLSSVYAPFYAMSSKKNGNKLALIKCEVLSKDCYPEDDFIMYCMKKTKYTQEELDEVSLKKNKFLWKESLRYIGNIAVRPEDIKILGVRYFDGSKLIFKCDPVISPINFKIMGEYYMRLTEWIYQGNEIMKFPNFM
jgi:hypothetical protein